MMDNIYEECFPHICLFSVCLTAGVFITPRSPGNEMVSFCGGTIHVLVKNSVLAV